VGGEREVLCQNLRNLDDAVYRGVCERFSVLQLRNECVVEVVERERAYRGEPRGGKSCCGQRRVAYIEQNRVEVVGEDRELLLMTHIGAERVHFL